MSEYREALQALVQFIEADSQLKFEWFADEPRYHAAKTLLARAERAITVISEDLLRNTRAWAAARPDMSGSSVIVAAIDELIDHRAGIEPQQITRREAIGMLERYRLSTNATLATNDPTNEELYECTDAASVCLYAMGVKR